MFACIAKRPFRAPSRCASRASMIGKLLVASVFHGRQFECGEWARFRSARWRDAISAQVEPRNSNARPPRKQARMCRGWHVLEPLALRLPAAWGRPQALASNCAGTLAGTAGRARTRSLPTRSHANDRGNLCPRYHFSNLSEDIKRLYRESLVVLGVRWTRPSSKQIAVYRKESVRILDQFIGPKT